MSVELFKQVIKDQIEEVVEGIEHTKFIMDQAQEDHQKVLSKYDEDRATRYKKLRFLESKKEDLERIMEKVENIEGDTINDRIYGDDEPLVATFDLETLNSFGKVFEGEIGTTPIFTNLSNLKPIDGLEDAVKEAKRMLDTIPKIRDSEVLTPKQTSDSLHHEALIKGGMAYQALLNLHKKD